MNSAKPIYKSYISGVQICTVFFLAVFLLAHTVGEALAASDSPELDTKLEREIRKEAAKRYYEDEVQQAIQEAEVEAAAELAASADNTCAVMSSDAALPMSADKQPASSDAAAVSPKDTSANAAQDGAPAADREAPADAAKEKPAAKTPPAQPRENIFKQAIRIFQGLMFF